MIKVVGFNRDQLNGVEVQQRGKHGCKRAAWLGSQSGGVLKRACLVLNPYWRHRLGLVKPWPSSAVDNGVLNAYWRHRLGLGKLHREDGPAIEVLNAYWRHRLGLADLPKTARHRQAGAQRLLASSAWLGPPVRAVLRIVAVLNAYWRHRLGLGGREGTSGLAGRYVLNAYWRHRLGLVELTFWNLFIGLFSCSTPIGVIGLAWSGVAIVAKAMPLCSTPIGVIGLAWCVVGHGTSNLHGAQRLLASSAWLG